MSSELESEMRSTDDPQRFWSLTLAFHSAVVDASRSPRIKVMQRASSGTRQRSFFEKGSALSGGRHHDRPPRVLLRGIRVTDRIYIHEFIDVRGHNRSNYMHHMTANWSPTAQAERHQLCYGVWALLGSTGPWPQVVNMWEEDGWDGLAASFALEAVGTGAQDPKLEKWWAKASEFRRGGFDRIMLPASWTRTIEQLCAEAVRGKVYAHELVRVRPGSAAELLERAREGAVEPLARHGWELIGAFTTALVDDDEALLLWAIPTWQHWADGERAHTEEDDLIAWRVEVRDVVTGWHRILLVDAPLSPLRTGRQPAREDRTDWVE